MIPVIHELLKEWARYKSGSTASVSPYAWARLITESEVFASNRQNYIPLDSLSCQQIDRCLGVLGVLHPPQYQAVAEYYLYVSTMEEKCRRCRCSEKTLYRRLHKAHGNLEVMLRDWLCHGIEPMSAGYLRSKSNGVDKVTENSQDPHKLA